MRRSRRSVRLVVRRCSDGGEAERDPVRRTGWLGSSPLACLLLVSACGGIEQSHSYVQSDDGSTLASVIPRRVGRAVDVRAARPRVGHRRRRLASSPLERQRHPRSSRPRPVRRRPGPAPRPGLATTRPSKLGPADPGPPATGATRPLVTIQRINGCCSTRTSSTTGASRGITGPVRGRHRLGDTAIAEHLAVLDPDRTRIQRIRVACSTSVCFEANSADHRRHLRLGEVPVIGRRRLASCAPWRTRPRLVLGVGLAATACGAADGPTGATRTDTRISYEIPVDFEPAGCSRANRRIVGRQQYGPPGAEISEAPSGEPLLSR